MTLFVNKMDDRDQHSSFAQVWSTLLSHKTQPSTAICPSALYWSFCEDATRAMWLGQDQGSKKTPVITSVTHRRVSQRTFHLWGKRKSKFLFLVQIISFATGIPLLTLLPPKRFRWLISSIPENREDSLNWIREVRFNGELKSLKEFAKGAHHKGKILMILL